MSNWNIENTGTGLDHTGELVEMENKLIYPYAHWATDNERAPRLRIISKYYKKQNEIKII